METTLLPRRGAPLIGFFTGIVSFALLLILDTPLAHSSGGKPAIVAAVGALMAIWWLTEAVPISITACVPIIAFPLLGVFDGGFFPDLLRTILHYLEPYIWLFAGGMCIAAAMQQWNLHKRIALTIMNIVGSDPKRLLGGMLISTAFISQWLSNTACAALMFPIGLAIIHQLEHHHNIERLRYYGMALMLSIAYGANLSLGTKISTAPNALFSGFMEDNGMPVSFLQFMIIGFPLVFLLIPIVWFVLWRLARRDHLKDTEDKNVIKEQLRALGHVKPQEKATLIVFGLTAVVWIMSKQVLDLLQPLIDVKLSAAHIEGGISLLAGIVLLLLRVGKREVLAPSSLKNLPWGTLVLLGGSFSLAGAVQSSGLSVFFGEQLQTIQKLSGFWQIILVSVTTVAITAVASNTATIAVMLNVLKGVISPSLLPVALFTSTFASSCDFALPAGTPPNAIVFGSGYVTIPQMAKTGVVLDLTAAVIVGLWCWFIVPLVL